MSPGEFESLVIAVATAKEGLSLAGLIDAIAEAGTNDREQAEAFVTAFLGAHSVQQRRKAAPHEIGEAIAADIALKLDSEEQTALADRYDVILAEESLALLARANLLYREDERTFCNARTISDLRPIFVADSSPSSIEGVVVHHSLRIDYHSDQRVQTFHVTIDNRALGLLAETIARAIAKGAALEKLAGDTGVRVVDIENHHA